MSRRLVSCLALALASAAAAESSQPPVAERRPFDVVSPHGTRNDPYHWLRDDSRSKPDVLGYLRAEQAYYESQSSRYAALTETIYQEILGRLKQDDDSVPYKYKDHVYFTRYETGKPYPIAARRPVGGGAERILVDANREGEGKSYYSLGSWAVSPDQTLLAFQEDTRGRYSRRSASARFPPDATCPTASTGSPRASPGRATARRSSTSRTTRSRCSRRGSSATCSARIRSSIRWSTRRRTPASIWASATPATRSTS